MQLDDKKASTIEKMIKKYGDSNEKIHFSDHLVKINRRERKQVRYLIITNKAVYNLSPTNLGKCKRRFTIGQIGSITISKLSDEFVLHVWDEYDYRFKSNKKELIKNTLIDLYYETKHDSLNVKYKLLNSLRDCVLTKKKSRQQTREEKMVRRRILMELESDDSDKEESEKQTAENILDPSKKIGIKDFVLLKVIGRGTFGKVLQVRKKDTGEILAMKILKKSGVIYQNQIAHTNAERKILNMCNHPFLMKLRYAFRTKAKLYIVTDFYKGGELFFHLKKKNMFKENEARFIVAETILAIGHLHKNGVFYRDLKPENILLDDEGHICLTDFGLSKLFEEDEERKADTFCGTPEYLAPEIIKRNVYTRTVDWWSLGILLYELVVGFPPFSNKSNQQMYQRILKEEIIYPQHISSTCKDLLTKLLKKDTRERLGSGESDCEEIMAHKFFKNINWEEMMVKKVSPVYKPKVKSRPNDTTNFDSEFTTEPVVDSIEADLSLTEDYFHNFSYQGK